MTYKRLLGDPKSALHFVKGLSFSHNPSNHLPSSPPLPLPSPKYNPKNQLTLYGYSGVNLLGKNDSKIIVIFDVISMNFQLTLSSVYRSFDIIFEKDHHGTW